MGTLFILLATHFAVAMSAFFAGLSSRPRGHQPKATGEPRPNPPRGCHPYGHGKPNIGEFQKHLREERYRAGRTRNYSIKGEVRGQD